MGPYVLCGNPISQRVHAGGGVRVDLTSTDCSLCGSKLNQAPKVLVFFPCTRVPFRLPIFDPHPCLRGAFFWMVSMGTKRKPLGVPNFCAYSETRTEMVDIRQNVGMHVHF